MLKPFLRTLLQWSYWAAWSIGLGLLVLSVQFYVSFDRLAAAEQALTPGEKSLGVAALAMIHLPRILVTGASGLSIIGVGTLGWALYRRKFSN